MATNKKELFNRLEYTTVCLEIKLQKYIYINIYTITGGQSSSGTLKVAPSGGNCVVGDEGDAV